MESLDRKWDVDSFNLPEANTLSELLSNLRHLNDYSWQVQGIHFVKTLIQLQRNLNPAIVGG